MPFTNFWGTIASVNNHQNVGFGVLTAVVMKCAILLDITQCSLLRVNQRFKVTHHPIFRIKNKLCLLPAFMLVPCSPYSSAQCSPKCQLTFNGLHGIISQKTVTTTALKCSCIISHTNVKKGVSETSSTFIIKVDVLNDDMCLTDECRCDT
jgi:hypothetical protein